MGKVLSRYNNITDLNFFLTMYMIFENIEKHQAEAITRSQTLVGDEFFFYFTQKITENQLT